MDLQLLESNMSTITMVAKRWCPGHRALPSLKAYFDSILRKEMVNVHPCFYIQIDKRPNWYRAIILLFENSILKKSPNPLKIFQDFVSNVTKRTQKALYRILKRIFIKNLIFTLYYRRFYCENLWSVTTWIMFWEFNSRIFTSLKLSLLMNLILRRFTTKNVGNKSIYQCKK